MIIEITEKLKLPIESDEEKIILEGYGGGYVTPLGITTCLIGIDELEIEAKFYVVPNNVQEVDIIVGGAITDKDGFFVYKTTDFLKITGINIFQNLPDFILDNEPKLKINLRSDTVICPGVNLVEIKTEIQKGMIP